MNALQNKMNTPFIVLNGNNGASYILNINSLTSIDLSLRFYRATSLKQKAFKHLLKISLYFSRLYFLHFTNSISKSVVQVKSFLSQLGIHETISISENCSILISPTRDKVIVHHHSSHFQKFAIGKSYNNVKREAEIYKLLSKPMESFAISNFYGYVDDGSSCSFKMSATENKNHVAINLADLTTPLADFFCAVDTNSLDLVKVLSNLKNDYNDEDNKVAFEDSDVTGEILFIINKCMRIEGKTIPLGLVHGDFKPWNVLYTKPLTIFDFEEACTSGFPLEDYLNFIIDPIVRHQGSEQVCELLFDTDTVNLFKDYLYKVNCNVNYKVLIYLYLLGRVLFWSNQGQENAAISYFSLLKAVDTSRYKLDV